MVCRPDSLPNRNLMISFVSMAPLCFIITKKGPSSKLKMALLAFDSWVSSESVFHKHLRRVIQRQAR